VICLIVYSLIMMGKYSFFEKILITFVGTMGLSFFVTMFLVLPDSSEMVKGLIP
jgi:manganese transport protein